MSLRKAAVLVVSMFLVGSAYTQIVQPQAEVNSPSVQNTQNVPDDTLPYLSVPIPTTLEEPILAPLSETNSDTSNAPIPTLEQPLSTSTSETLSDPSSALIPTTLEQPILASTSEAGSSSSGSIDVLNSENIIDPITESTSDPSIGSTSDSTDEPIDESSNQPSGVNLLGSNYDEQIDQNFEYFNNKQLHRNLRVEPESEEKEDQSIENNIEGQSTDFSNDFPSIHKLKVKHLPVAMF